MGKWTDSELEISERHVQRSEDVDKVGGAK